MENMEWAYAAADLVVCRAGASTLAELSAQQKPAVLVPFPSSAAGHQQANAETLVASGSAIMILEKDLPERLATVLDELLISPDGHHRRKTMADAYRRLRLPPAAQTPILLADALEGLSRV